MAAAVSAHIVVGDPQELTTARADLPPALDRIVRHAFEKNPAERFQSARDVIFALEALSGSNPISTGRPAVDAAKERATPKRARDLTWAAVTLLALAVGVAGGSWVRRSPPTGADHPTTGPGRAVRPAR